MISILTEKTGFERFGIPRNEQLKLTKTKSVSSDIAKAAVFI